METFALGEGQYDLAVVFGDIDLQKKGYVHAW